MASKIKGFLGRILGSLTFISLVCGLIAFVDIKSAICIWLISLTGAFVIFGAEK